MKRVLLLIGIVAVGAWAWPQLPSSVSHAPAAPESPENRAAREAAQRMASDMKHAPQTLELNATNLSKDYGVMTVTFTFTNPSDFDLKDIEVRCEHSAPSGTNIDLNDRTVYELVPARGRKTVRQFNMGFVAPQAVRSGCYVRDAKVGAYHPRPVAKPTPATPKPQPKPQ